MALYYKSPWIYVFYIAISKEDQNLLLRIHSPSQQTRLQSWAFFPFPAHLDKLSHLFLLHYYISMLIKCSATA